MDTKPKILIVEDYEHNHKLYRDVFGNAGFEVTIFHNADGNFTDNVIAVSPDIISMDIMMGLDGKPAERDGFDAIEQLKTDPRTSEIPIFVLTSFSAKEKVDRAKELGAVDFINTPSQTFARIPDYFLNYLEDPENHTPVHPHFRK